MPNFALAFKIQDLQEYTVFSPQLVLVKLALHDCCTVYHQYLVFVRSDKLILKGMTGGYCSQKFSAVTKKKKKHWEGRKNIKISMKQRHSTIFYYMAG